MIKTAARWFSWIPVVILALAVAVTSCSQPAATPAAPAAAPTAAPANAVAPTADKPITARIISYGGATYAPRKYQEQWMKLVEERTNGRVKFEFFPSESLVKIRDSWDAIGGGVVEGGLTALYDPAKQGIIEGTYLMPFNWEWNSFMKKYKQPGGFYDWAAPMWEQRGKLKIVMWSAHGGFEFTGRTEKDLLKTQADFKGKLIRALASLNRPLEILGAAPADVATADVYNALQRGTIDISMHSLDAIESNKFYEVGPYVTVANLTSSAIVFTLNMNFYNSLPADIRSVMDQTTKELDTWYVESLEEMFAGVEKRLAAAPKVKVYQVPDEERAKWKTALKPYYEELAKKYGADWEGFAKVWNTLQ